MPQLKHHWTGSFDEALELLDKGKYLSPKFWQISTKPLWSKIKNLTWKFSNYTEVRFTSFLSGGFTKGQEISKRKYGVVPLPKIWTKNFKNSALNTWGRIFQIFSFIFWAIRRLYIFILKFIDLYYGSNDFTGKETGKKHLCDISENAQYRSNFFSDVTDMVPFIIWAPAFFGPQKIWFPRMLVPAGKCHIMSFMRVLNFLGPRFL